MPTFNWFYAAAVVLLICLVAIAAPFLLLGMPDL